MMGSVDDNRKRNLTDGDDDINSILSSKRAALRDAGISSGAETHDHLIKFLCPSAVAGSIIGRGGSVINDLNQATGAKIKVSQNGEFFPTTNDRVIAVSGSMTAISAAIQELITRIIESPDKKNSQGDLSIPSNSPAQLRILIPATASGVMIGRQGSVIRTMSESSSCIMQLAEVHDPQNTKERIMMIISKDGQLSNLILGAQLAMRQLFSDPVAGVYVNGRTSYGTSGAPPPGPLGFGGRGSGSAPMSAPYFPQQHHQGNSSRMVIIEPANRMKSGPPDYPSQGGRTGPPPNQSGDMTMDQGLYQQPRPMSYLQQSQQQQYNQSLVYAQKSALTEISPPTYSIDGLSIIMTLGIPDSLVGSILGRQGCVVKEIMSLSGTVIQISQKEQYLPDTKNRAVTVVGLQHQIQIALSMIMAKAQSPPQGVR